jgi:hypothetical protein
METAPAGDTCGPDAWERCCCHRCYGDRCCGDDRDPEGRHREPLMTP